MKINNSKVPANSLAEKYLPADYSEAYETIVENHSRLTSENLLIAFWTDFPVWVRWLFSLRDILVKPFGLKGADDNDNSFQQKFTEMVRTGGIYKQMSVIAKNENETVLQIADKHLTAELSVHIENIIDNNLRINTITIVHYHNAFGKIYFNVIKPFHKIIVKAIIKKNLTNVK